MNLLSRHLRHHSPTLALATLLSAVSGGLTMALMAYTNRLAASGVDNPLAAVKHSALLIGGLMIISATTQTVLARLGARIAAALRRDIALRFINAEYERVAGRTHQIYGAITQDLDRIGPLVLIAPQLGYNALLLILCSVYLASISLTLYSVFMSFMGAVLVVAVLTDKLANPHFDSMRQAESRFFDALRIFGEGKKELSLNPGRARGIIGRTLQPSIEDAQREMTRVHVRWGIAESWSAAALNCAILTIVLVGYSILELPAAEMIQFVIGALFLIGPLNFVVQAGPNVGLGLAAIRNLQSAGLDLHAELSEQTPSDKTGRDFPGWRSLEAVDLLFHYQSTSGAPLPSGVGPVSLNIRRGETVFIVGRNGSGKSTLLLMLCGLLMPRGGSLRLDGLPIERHIEQYRRLFSGTFCDAFIFDHIVDSDGNLKAGPDALALLEQVGLDSELTIKDGVLTKTDLSSGQRKRLALAQCLAEDREIYFFDEWAAEQDPLFRESFYHSTLADLKRRGKTVIVVTHDESYFYVADRVIELERGLIVKSVQRDDPLAASILRPSAAPVT